MEGKGSGAWNPGHSSTSAGAGAQPPPPPPPGGGGGGGPPPPPPGGGGGGGDSLILMFRFFRFRNRDNRQPEGEPSKTTRVQAADLS